MRLAQKKTQVIGRTIQVTNNNGGQDEKRWGKTQITLALVAVALISLVLLVLIVALTGHEISFSGQAGPVQIGIVPRGQTQQGGGNSQSQVNGGEVPQPPAEPSLGEPSSFGQSANSCSFLATGFILTPSYPVADVYFATQHYFYYDGDSVEIGLTDWISWSQPEVWVYPRSDLQYAQWRNVHQFSGVNVL